MTALTGMRAFLRDALGSALALGVASPEDILAHATADVLSLHLPRPVWTQLLAACLAAPRTDARLVVDTVTVPVLCEHVPEPILWACLAQLGSRALGRGILAPPPPMVAATTAPAAPVTTPAPTPVPAPAAAVATPASTPAAAPPASAPTPAARPPVAATPSRAAEPAPEVTRVAPAPTRVAPARAPTAEPAPLEPPPRPSTAARTTLGARRPQAAAPAPARRAEAKPVGGRAATATDFDLEADVGDGWKKDSEQVDDDQLIDWSQNEETMTGGDGAFTDRRR